MRQDLWVAHLSGCPNKLLHTILSSLSSLEYIEDSFKYQIQSLILNPIPEHLLQDLSHLERIIVCLLILGCDTSIISAYTGIIEVKVNNAIVALQEGEHGIKATL